MGIFQTIAANRYIVQQPLWEPPCLGKPFAQRDYIHTYSAKQAHFDYLARLKS